MTGDGEALDRMDEEAKTDVLPDTTDAVLGPNTRDGTAEWPTAEPQKPIYMTPGREGMAASRIRRLVTMVELPDRRKETFQARNLLMESDIREAMAKAAVKLHNHFLKRYSVLGFTFDPDAIEYDFQRLKVGMDIGADTAIKHTEGLARVIVASVVIRRG